MAFATSSKLDTQPGIGFQLPPWRGRSSWNEGPSRLESRAAGSFDLVLEDGIARFRGSALSTGVGGGDDLTDGLLGQCPADLTPGGVHRILGSGGC